MHQNVKIIKSGAARTVYGLIFLHFYVIIISYVSFFYQNSNITGSNYAINGCNLSKKHKLALYQTQSGEPNYVGRKILLNYFAKLTAEKLGE